MQMLCLWPVAYRRFTIMILAWSSSASCSYGRLKLVKCYGFNELQMQWYDPFEYGKLLPSAGVIAEEVKSAGTERKSRRMLKSGLIDPKYSRVQFYLFAKLIQCHWINSAPTDKRWTLGLTLSEYIIGFSLGRPKKGVKTTIGDIHSSDDKRRKSARRRTAVCAKERLNSRWLVDEDVVCSGAWVIQLAGDLVRVATKETPERV